MIDEFSITFNGPGAATRDRGGNTRNDPEKVAALWADPNARLTPVWRGKPLFALGDRPRLAWLDRTAPIAAEAVEAPVLLGLEGGAGRFAIDVSAWDDPDADETEMAKFLDASQNAHPSLPANCKFIELRSVMGELDAADAADAATAKGALEWHRSHPFCAKCGAKSDIDQGGWRRVCATCGATHFPRTDPVVIMLVLHRDKALLGRQSFWPERMYSLLAGFMEPGETIEAAVRRETWEEAGVPVARVRYVACQPWPFPASLMIACVAEAETDELRPDYDEIEEAFWVTRTDIADALAGRNEAIGPARPGAIARDVLAAWARGDIPDFD